MWRKTAETSTPIRRRTHDHRTAHERLADLKPLEIEETFSVTSTPTSIRATCSVTETHERFADPEPLGLEESEDHATAEQDHVALPDESLDHRDLIGYFHVEYWEE